MSKWSLEDDPLAQAEEVRRRKFIGGDPEESTSFLSMPLNPTAQNVQRLASNGRSGTGMALPGGVGGGPAASAAPTAAPATAATGTKVASNILDWMKLIIPTATSFAGGMLQGDPFQKRQSFTGDISAPTLLRKSMANVDSLGSALTDQISKPTSLRTTVNSQPGFTKDPAIADPSLLSRPGLSLPSGMFGSGPKIAPDIDGRPSPEDKADIRKRKVDGTTPGGFGAGGNADGLPTGVDIRSLTDLFNMLQDPLFYSKKKPADGGGK